MDSLHIVTALTWTYSKGPLRPLRDIDIIPHCLVAIVYILYRCAYTYAKKSIISHEECRTFVAADFNS